MIYLDHSATTPVDPRVVEAMLPYWTEVWGNPSSLYRHGRRAGAAVEQARADIATILNCRPAEVLFTSCGTESDNLALRGVALSQAAHGRRHIITTPVEHHAITHTAADLAQAGFEITFLPVDDSGRVDPEEVARALRPDTALVSVMYANNEVGTVQPIAEIGAITRRAGVPFHTDAVQAGGYLPLDVEQLQVDLLSLSAHKFYGPKGVGLLYVRRGTPLQPEITGGGQERGRRAGTENVAYIAGIACALQVAQDERETEGHRLLELRERMTEGLLQTISGASLTGHPQQRLPGHVSLVIPGVEANSLLIALDLAGIAASSGSACASGAAEPSHVLAAMHYEHALALSALRLTMGRQTTAEEIDTVLERMPAIVEQVRSSAGTPG